MPPWVESCSKFPATLSESLSPTWLALPGKEIWRDYNRRADVENRIAELKHDLAADDFCLRDHGGKKKDTERGSTRPCNCGRTFLLLNFSVDKEYTKSRLRSDSFLLSARPMN
jgi:hypothetical protein